MNIEGESVIFHKYEQCSTSMFLKKDFRKQKTRKCQIVIMVIFNESLATCTFRKCRIKSLKNYVKPGYESNFLVDF